MVPFPPEPEPSRPSPPDRRRDRAMIRRPLRPLARILTARAEGRDPNLVEAEERAARLAAMQRAERARAETRLLLLGLGFVLAFSVVAGRMALLAAAVPVEPRAGDRGADPRAARRDRRPQRRGARHQPRHRLALRPAARDDRPRRHRRRARRHLPRPRRRRPARPLHRRPQVPLDQAHRSRPSSASSCTTSASPACSSARARRGSTRTARSPPTCSAAPATAARASHAAEVIGTAGVEKVFDARLRDPERDRRAAAPLDRPRGAGRARGGAGRRHGRAAAPRAPSAS